MYVVKDLVPVSWEFVDKYFLKVMPVVPWLLLRLACKSAQFFSALSYMKKMLHALAGYSKSYSCQVSVKGTAQRYMFVVIIIL